MPWYSPSKEAPLRLIYCGTDVFYSCFSYFVRNHEVLALYTYHRDEDSFSEYSVVQLAKEKKIPVFYGDLTEEEERIAFDEKGCDFIFSAEYNRILPTNGGRKGFRGINVHCALLPQGRSYYPIECMMDRNLDKSGVTMHKMVSAVDSGDILGQESFPVTPSMDSIDCYLRAGEAAERLLHRLMGNFEEIWKNAKEQAHDKSFPYWKKPEAEKLCLRHDLTREEAESLYRKYNQLMYIEYEGSVYYIRSLRSGETPLPEPLRRLDKDAVFWKVRDGHLRLILRKKEDAR